MKTFLLLIILSSVVISVSAQISPSVSSPTVIDENAELINDPKLKELTELLSNPELDCKKETSIVTGTISKLYFNNGGKTLSAFEITDAKRKLYSINLTYDPLGAVGKYSFETIRGVFTRKRKIEASYVECREPGTKVFNYAAQVKVD